MKSKHLPLFCPSCESSLQVKQLECIECETIVEGRFDLPVLARLQKEDRDFVTSFIKASGSLKDLAKVYGVSYPTVRNRLDALIERIISIDPPVEP